jgi:putative transposase
MVRTARLPMSKDEIKAILSELAAGRTVREVSRTHRISTNTLYRWRARQTNGQPPKGNMRLQSLEVENRRLKKELAELSLEHATLRAALIRDVMGDC